MWIVHIKTTKQWVCAAECDKGNLGGRNVKKEANGKNSQKKYIYI